MFEQIFIYGMNALAFVTPISIAATNLVFFPLLAVWLLGGRATLLRWPPRWGLAEKVFLLYLGVSVVSAFAGVDVRRSLGEIWKTDFYLVIALLIASVTVSRRQNEKLLHIFMAAGALVAVWGLIQFATGVNQSDKSGGVFYTLPSAIAQWPRPILDHLSMVNGRVIGTRSHPLTYAECLLFHWAFGICFLLSSSGRRLLLWFVYLASVGGALLVSQSRGPWLAAAVMVIVAILTSRRKRSMLLVLLGGIFALVFLSVPTLHKRAASITDSTHHSNRDRLNMWKAGYSLFQSNPFFGVGPGNVKKVSPPFQDEADRRTGPWGHLHSNYVNIMAERGGLGLFMFLAFFAALVKELWDAFRRSRHAYDVLLYRGAGLAMLGFFLGGVTETSYNAVVVMMMFYFVIGLAKALAGHENEPA